MRRMSPELDALFRDLDVRGRTSGALDDAFAELLGRGLGTYARRRGLSRTTFVIGRDEGAHVGPLRDGLVRGLVLSGQDVLDVGVVDARRHEFAMVHRDAGAGIFVSGPEVDAADDSAGFEILLGGGPVVGPHMHELKAVVARGDFTSGEGSLELIDVDDAWREAEASGEIPGLGRDTQVVR
jgi:phosphomannomutase